MFIYVLFKIIIEFFGKYFNKDWLRYIYIFFEFFIVFFYLFFFYLDLIDLNFYLFIWCLFWIFLFISFKFLKLVFNNLNDILIRIEQKEKIKVWLLKPSICKSIYYLVWLLPWNIMYWIYFWIMENGWYFRVWFCSNRDIFFKKYFGWDSREFFYNLNKILFENFIFKFIYFFKGEIIKFFLRILLVLSFLRKNLYKASILYYLLNRIFIFCYLSFFYLSFFEYIHFFNRWIVVVIFIFEIIIFFLIGIFLEYLLNYNRFLIEHLIKFFGSKMIQLLMDPLTYKYYVPTKMFFEVNNMVWNEILGNSITLGILKEYMLWVNKNTKGYYYKKMNILPKININRLFELNSIPFDILPNTRYVIMQLRYVNNNFYKIIAFGSSNNKNLFVMPDYRINKMKNLYLSYFEKIYAVDSSLLSIIFLLRINFELNYFLLSDFYNKFGKQSCGKIINYFMLQKKALFWKYRLVEISRSNPELLNVFYILNMFSSDNRLYDMEGYFMFNFFSEDLKKKIPDIKYDGSLKKYKDNIKLLSHFLLYEEQGIVWNDDIQKFLKFFEDELNVNRKQYSDVFFNIYEDYNKPGLTVYMECNDFSLIENQILNIFKLDFNKKFDLEFLLNLDLQTIKKKNLFLLKLDKQDILDFSLLDDFVLFIENFETINLEDSKYSFLFDNDD